MHAPPPPREGPRGRRDNGLVAQEWGALVDVDPRLSDQLLELLAGAGVAAHVEPAGATTDPVSRAGTMPARPLDRLWVDVARADAARQVVEAEAEDVVASLREQGDSPPGIDQFLHAVPRGASGRVLKPPPRLDPPAPMSDPADSETAGSDTTGSDTTGSGTTGSDTADSDAAWRAIVEGFERTSDSPVPPWPVEEDVPEPPSRRDRPTAERPPPRRRRSDGPPRTAEEAAGPGAALPGWVEPEALGDEGHYVPPPPPPPPRIKPRTLGAVAAIVFGILLLFAPSLLDVAPGGGSYLLGILLTGGGAGALVYWMRDAPGADDDPDGGAVV